MAAECVGERSGVLKDIGDRVCDRQSDDAFLQVDENESGFGVEDSDWQAGPPEHAGFRCSCWI
jgi:hypothetical protein